MALLGHVTPKMTRRYATLASPSLRAGYDAAIGKVRRALPGLLHRRGSRHPDGRDLAFVLRLIPVLTHTGSVVVVEPSKCRTVRYFC